MILKLVSCCSAAVVAGVSLSQLSGTAVPLFLLFQTSECGDCCTLLSSPRGLLDKFGVMWLAGKCCRFVLAYWYFPTELNWIMRCFQGKHRWEKKTCLSNTYTKFVLLCTLCTSCLNLLKQVVILCVLGLLPTAVQQHDRSQSDISCLRLRCSVIKSWLP